MKQKLLALLASASLLGGCATTDNKAAADEPKDEGVRVTGSRLPHKTTGSAPVSQTSKEGWEENTRGHKQINPQGK